MTHNYQTLHEDFRLNGLYCKQEDLKHLGYSLVKEGEQYEMALGQFFLDWSDDSDTIKVNTSGSTGEPRAVPLKKEYMVNSALATGEYFELKAGDEALLCLPGDYIAGKMMLVRAMILGLHLDYVEPSSRPLYFNSKEYDFCAMVPLQLENSITKLDRIKTLIVGGVPISNSIKTKTQNSACQVFETYGMTETISHIAVKRINKEPEIAFKTLPNIAISKDNRQCLIIEAPNISDEPVITNDLVELISETEFKWLGRYDNAINSGGVKLFPEQIEAKLSKVISNRFFVTGLPDEKLGQKLVLMVEGETDIKLLSKKIDALASLGKYEVPKAIHCLPKFLETKTGKIRRAETAHLVLGI